MSERQFTAADSIESFVRGPFAERLAGLSRQRTIDFARAIINFGKFLNREPQFRHLTEDSLASWVRWLQRQEYTSSSAHGYTSNMRLIWRAAHEAGVAGLAEPPRRYARKVRPWHHRKWAKMLFEPQTVTAPPAAPDSLAELLDQYRLEHDITQATIKQHRYAITSFGKFLGRMPALADLNDESVKRFIVALQATDLSPHSIKSKRRILLTLWRAAYEAGAVHLPPRRVRKIKAPPTIPQAWTIDEVRRLIRVAAETPGHFRMSNVKKGPFGVAFIPVAICTALRLGDLLRLEFRQIDRSGWFTIVQQKTRFPIQCYLQPFALRAVADIEQPKRPLVFGSVACRSVLQGWFHTIVRRAGLKGSAKTLRSTAATLAECHLPGSASWLLGHRDATLARRHYIDAGHVQHARPLLPAITLDRTEGAA